MNEGVPNRTVVMMIIATVIAAVIVALILIYLGAPPGYVYHAASAVPAPAMAKAIISTAAAVAG